MSVKRPVDRRLHVKCAATWQFRNRSAYSLQLGSTGFPTGEMGMLFCQFAVIPICVNPGIVS